MRPLIDHLRRFADRTAVLTETTELTYGQLADRVEALLKAYVAHRASPDETFLSFARRHDGETLRKLADAKSTDVKVPA